MILNFIKQIVSAVKDASKIDVQATDALGNTALIEAALSNATDTVMALLKAGSDPNAPGFMNQTALTWAAKKNNTKIIRLLISYGANINGIHQPSWLFHTPLGEAASVNAVEAAQMLIDNGADLNSHNSSAETPLIIAAKTNALEVANVLIQSGANLEAKGDIGYSNTALCSAVLAGHEEMTELLLKNNAKVKALNRIKKQIPPTMKRWLKAKEIIK